MIKKQVFNFFIFTHLITFSQTDSSKNIQLSSYAEIYYGYNLDATSGLENVPFLFNHKRNKEISCNLLLLKASYQKNRMRSTLGLMAGDYARYNLNSEPQWARYLYEANIGIKLNRNKNLWLDLGVFPSHIGFESAIGIDCWTLTRSLLAENSPYYESGAKMSFISVNEKVTAALFLLNGWQRIQYNPSTDLPALGTQFTWKPNASTTFNYSTFAGYLRSDSLLAFRHFHNIYANINLTKKTGIIIGFDLGQEKRKALRAIWFSPVIIIRQSLNDKFNLSLRAEYYSDEKGIVLKTDQSSGSSIAGFSAGLHYQLNEHAAFRVEGKSLLANKSIFANKKRENYSLTTGLMIQF